MRVRIDNPNLMNDLLDVLADSDCVAVRTGADVCEVLHPAAALREQRIELRFFLRAWASTRGGEASLET